MGLFCGCTRNDARTPLHLAAGAFEILNSHAPIISALGKGQIRIVEDNADHSEQLFDIEGGIVEVKSNKVNVLIEK